ncbi:MAG: hypothetical protein QOI61_2115 [Actinomycetota bacterium]
MTVAVKFKSRFTLAQTMQRLWTDHVVWKRQYLLSALDDQPDMIEAAARLLRNQEEIGRLVEKYYGRKAGKRVTSVLKQHMLMVVDLIEAAKNVDRQKYHDIDATLQSNAQDIADAFGDLNESWVKTELSEMWSLHLELTKAQLTARLEENYDRDVDTFDEILTATLTIADRLSDGIIQQFADKFAA